MADLESNTVVERPKLADLPEAAERSESHANRNGKDCVVA